MVDLRSDVGAFDLWARPLPLRSATTTVLRNAWRSSKPESSSLVEVCTSSSPGPPPPSPSYSPTRVTPLYAWYALTRTWYVPSCGVGNSHTSELPALYGRQSYTESVASSANFTSRSASPVPPEMRSAARRVGKGGGSKGWSRWSP